MMDMFERILNQIVEWTGIHFEKLFFSFLAAVAFCLIYLFIKRRVVSLEKQEKISKDLAFNIRKISQWSLATILLVFIFVQFNLGLGLITGFVAVTGGTIVGFAAMNTLGNAIAGVIIMISKPFEINDVVLYDEQFVDVIAVDLIYTKMKQRDNVVISIPNQELLQSKIENYGQNKLIRRQCTVTPGFEYDLEKVKRSLSRAASEVDGILSSPEPFVRITGFHDYAVEYTLYAYTRRVKNIPDIDADLYERVLKVCKEKEIDISTPLLLKQV